jgi:hypothetical protein
VTASPRLPAWRLTVLWQDTVLDTVTVAAAHHAVSLRTGDVFDVVVGDDLLEVRGERLEATLRPGQRVVLPAGHVLLAELDLTNPVAVGAFTIDSTLLHSGMIAVTMTICAVSALWLHPTAIGLDPGGGLASEHRRWLALTGGTGSTVGRAVFATSGRPLELGERFELRPPPGPIAPTTSSPPPERATLESTLADLSRALHPEGGHADSRVEPLGEAVRQVSAAPVLGAGVGGLSPRDPIDDGRGTGVIGAGDDRRLRAVERQQQRDEQRLMTGKKKTYPVTVADIPDADVGNGGRLDADPELDPLVREHLSRMIQTRHNVIRGCYESWGLASNAHQEGRFVLELTLRPDGRVEQLHTGRSDPGFDRVGACVVRAASEWYLGDGLVDEPTRLAFPFHLKARRPPR